MEQHQKQLKVNSGDIATILANCDDIEELSVTLEINTLLSDANHNFEAISKCTKKIKEICSKIIKIGGETSDRNDGKNRRQ